VLVLSVMVITTACGGSRPAPLVSPSPGVARLDAPVVPPAAPPRRTPPPGRPIPGAGPPGRVIVGVPREARSRDETLIFDGPVVRPRVGEPFYEKKSDFWSPCVRDFVETQPEAAREALGEALSLYSTTCTTGPAKRIEFRTPRAGRTVPAESHLGLYGVLEPGTCELSLEAAYRGEPVNAERVTLVADGVRWSSPRLDFARDDGWEIATLPLSRALVRVVTRAIDAHDTVLRFEGANGYEDVVVTDEMKQDLRVMIDALDAINRP